MVSAGARTRGTARPAGGSCLAPLALPASLRSRIRARRANLEEPGGPPEQLCTRGAASDRAPMTGLLEHGEPGRPSERDRDGKAMARSDSSARTHGVAPVSHARRRGPRSRPRVLKVLVPRVAKERGAAAGGAALLIRFLLASLLNYGLAFALAWILPPAQFGTVSLLQNTLLFSALVLNAGFPWVLARSLTSVPQRSERASRRQEILFRSALTCNIALGVVLGGILVVSQLLGHGIFPDASATLVGAVALTLPTIGATSALGGALQGLRRFGGQGAAQTIEVFVKCLVALALVLFLGWGAQGVAAGFLVGALVSAWYAAGALRDRLPGWGPVHPVNAARSALSMWIAGSSFAVLSGADVLSLGLARHTGVVAVALIGGYQVAVLLGRTLYYVADPLIDAVFPFMAGAPSTEDAHAWFAAAFRRVPVLILPIQVTLLVAPGPILALFFPSTYANTAVLVRVLDLATLGLILTAWFTKALYARDRAGVIMRRVPVGAGAEIAALLVLVPRYGVTGAAASALIGAWTAALLLARAYARLHGLRRPAVGTVARPVLALASMVPALLWAAARGGGAGCALIFLAFCVFILTARALRVLGDDDVARVRSSVRRFHSLIRGRGVRVRT